MNRKLSTEEQYEMDANFAPGDTIVNVLTGEVIREGKPGAPTQEDLVNKYLKERTEKEKWMVVVKEEGENDHELLGYPTEAEAEAWIVRVVKEHARHNYYVREKK